MKTVKTLTTEVVGMQYRLTPSTRKMIEAHVLNDGPMPCNLEREPHNPVDENAIRVLAAVTPYKGLHIGYVPRQVAARLAPKMDRGVKIENTWLAEVDPYDGTGDLVIEYLISVRPPRPQKKSPASKRNSSRT
jgi:hypothetical protein